MAFAPRMKRELDMLINDPVPGIAAWPASQDDMSELTAQISGPADTPYAGGVFTLCVSVPTRYPFEPPKVRFTTPIYHPNIDNGGRICLDTLNMPPKGAWRPSMNIPGVLTSIQSLLSEPNPDDGLMADITDEYRRNPVQFHATAKAWTTKYAHGRESSKPGSGSSDEAGNDGDSKGAGSVDSIGADAVDHPAADAEHGDSTDAKTVQQPPRKRSRLSLKKA